MSKPTVRAARTLLAGAVLAGAATALTDVPRTPAHAGVLVTAVASADAAVSKAKPDSNFGTAALKTDASPASVANSYLRFLVPASATPVARATLRVFAQSSSTVGYTVRTVSGSWDERTVTYRTAPTPGSTVGSSGAHASGVWTAVDVTRLVTAAGAVNLALSTTLAHSTAYGSRETSTPPQLVLETTSVSPTPTASATPTATPTASATPTATPTASTAPTASATPTASSMPSASTTPSASPAPSASPVAQPLSVQVSGNRLVDPAGGTVRLLGANRSGTQYACAEGWGFFQGPTDDTAIAAMAGWGMTAVRVSLNESCWLGINGSPAAYSGTAYRTAISSFVQRLNARGLRVILDLHWNAPGAQQARGQQPMADRDHAPAFWRSVAATFATNRSVVFDVYNEPYPDSNRNSTAAWTCVRDGGTCPGVPFTAAGSQELLDAIRSTGASNVVLVGGPRYAGDVDRWLEFAPHDATGQLAASVHIYGPDFSPCDLQSCWDGPLATLARQVPVVMGEIGTHTYCDHAFVDPVMNWADAHGVSYLGWSWIVGGCTTEPSLLLDYSGTPTAYGAGIRDHLRALAGLR